MAFGQSSRSAIMQQAQRRGQQAQFSSKGYQPSHTRVAQNTGVVHNTRPGSNVRVAAQGSGSRSLAPTPLAGSAPIVNQGAILNGSPVVSNQVSSPVPSSSPVIGSPAGAIRGGYVPQPALGDGQIISGGSPIVSDGYFDNSVVAGTGFNGGGGFSGGCNSCGVGGCGGSGGCGIGQCGIGSGYFSGSQCGRPTCFESCVMGCLSRVFRNAELIAGAQAFRSSNFSIDGTNVDDSSFGLYGGINLGVPLRRLTFGLFSGQIGVRSSQSEFDGDFFSIDNRDQLFLTAGLFRRVDYGVQIGVAVDFLNEEWFVETELSQLRGDIGWACPGGNSFGFRFAAGLDDDETNGIFNGANFDGLLAQVIDNYRFYYRFGAQNGGFCDAFVGWTDDSHAVLGLDLDMPISGRWGMQGGFTYFLPEDSPPELPISTQDAWNVFLGLTIRPQGAGWYRNYDRPLFNVADNGTFVFERN